MGGDNESVVKSDKKSEGVVLAADIKKKKKKKERVLQTQNIRQHVSGPEVHFHDDENKLKVAVPTAEWWNAIRNFGKLKSFTWIDEKNQAVAMPLSNEADVKVFDSNQLQIIFETYQKLDNWFLEFQKVA